MSTTRLRHLDEEAVLRGVVDAGDLTEQEKEHLISCRVCKEKVEGLTQSLHMLGERADACLPPASSTPRLPVNAPKNSRRFPIVFTGYRAWAGAAAAAVLLVCLFWMANPHREPSESLNLWRQTEAHMLFSAQESVQEEVLPSKLAQLLEAESFVLDKDFMEFVAPFEASNGEQVENGGLS